MKGVSKTMKGGKRLKENHEEKNVKQAQMKKLVFTNNQLRRKLCL